MQMHFEKLKHKFKCQCEGFGKKRLQSSSFGPGTQTACFGMYPMSAAPYPTVAARGEWAAGKRNLGW